MAYIEAAPSNLFTLKPFTFKSFKPIYIEAAPSRGVVLASVTETQRSGEAGRTLLVARKRTVPGPAPVQSIERRINLINNIYRTHRE